MHERNLTIKLIKGKLRTSNDKQNLKCKTDGQNISFHKSHESKEKQK